MILTCTGRPVDRYARPMGGPCGDEWSGETIDHAAALGWRVGPAAPQGPRPALCPRCVRGPAKEDDQGDTPSLSTVLGEQLELFPTPTTGRTGP